jgi:2-methylisocitrate lyase-like PEP mutase family enzyme
VEGGRTPILPPNELQAMGFSMAIYPSLGFLAAGQALREAYQNLQARAAFQNPTSAPALHDFQAFSVLMGFQRVWDFDREHAE